jgi:hypothetical protein
MEFFVILGLCELIEINELEKESQIYDVNYDLAELPFQYFSLKNKRVLIF